MEGGAHWPASVLGFRHADRQPRRWAGIGLEVPAAGVSDDFVRCGAEAHCARSWLFGRVSLVAVRFAVGGVRGPLVAGVVVARLVVTLLVLVAMEVARLPRALVAVVLVVTFVVVSRLVAVVVAV